MSRAAEKSGEALLTPAELSDRWQITEKTLAQWRWRSIGPRYIKLGGGRGGSVRYPMAAVEAYEAEHLSPQPA